MTDLIRTVIADDHPLFREGVVRSLSEAGGFDIVAEAGAASEAIELCTQLLPDVVLLDVSMPGGGIEAATQISRQCPAVFISMLTVSEQDADLLAAMKAGARGYILKGVASDELVRIVREIAAGQSYVSPSLAARVLSAMREDRDGSREQDPLDSLTRREEEILSLVAQGKSNREVGQALGLQEKTVKHYMTNILGKLHVRNRVEAALMAKNSGFVRGAGGVGG